MKNKWEYINNIKDPKEQYTEILSVVNKEMEVFTKWHEEHGPALEELTVDSYLVIKMLCEWSIVNKNDLFTAVMQGVEFGYYLGRNYQDVPEIFKKAEDKP